MYLCKTGDDYLYLILNIVVIYKTYACNTVCLHELLVKKLCSKQLLCDRKMLNLQIQPNK